MKNLFLWMALMLVPFVVQARPVSYPGGWTFMTMNKADERSVHVHYSPTAWMSIGYRGEYYQGDDFQLHAVQVNNLLKRWNKKESQANFYLKSGLGVAYSDAGIFDGKTEPAAFTGIATDWETRRYFVSYENRLTEAGDIADTFRHKARAGIAPYVADYGDLHTWLMLEVEHAPEAEDTVTVMPLVRFFKGTNLVEAGLSTEGEMLLNWIIRY